MDISIGSYKCRLEIVLIIIFLLIVLFGHTLCACSTGNLMEGFSHKKEGMNGQKKEGMNGQKKEGMTSQKKEGYSKKEGLSSKKEGYGPKKSAFSIMEGMLMPKAKPKEGFSNYKTNAGPQFAENGAPDYYIDPSKWGQPSLVYTAGTTPDAGVQSIWDRGKNQKPLNEGEMDFFANTQFKPECCPNTYSNSLGCACISTQQYNTLISRGGNNVPYSEY